LHGRTWQDSSLFRNRKRTKEECAAKTPGKSPVTHDRNHEKTIQVLLPNTEKASTNNSDFKLQHFYIASGFCP
jgi:hypothetical protein